MSSPKWSAESGLATLKLQMRSEIYAYLYTRPFKELTAELDNIILHNMRFQGSHDAWISYKGVRYSDSNLLVHPPRLLPRLHKSLQPRMDAYLKDTDEVKAESEHVEACLTVVLNASKSLQDYYKMLPSSLHGPLKQFNWIDSIKPAYSLSEEAINVVQDKIADGVLLMKQRMVRNLLL